MIFREKPKTFNPRFEIVSCFCECDGQILLLQRHEKDSQGSRWGLPAGKMNKNETEQEAILREIREETGFLIPDKNLLYFGKVFVKYPDYHFIYHIFHTRLDKKENVNISNEHRDFRWATPKEALKMNLVMDLDNCIRLFYGI